jgi:hypothetical protein
MPETRQLICEGWVDPEHYTGAQESIIFDPAVIYVRQGKKACFFKGKPTELHESVGDGVEIVESIENLELIREADGRANVKDGEWIVEGVFQRSGVKNANGRTYSRKLWERVLNETGTAINAIRDRSMIGHLEHPKDGRTDGNLGALLVLEAKLDNEGVVYGRAKILDTPPGKILKTYCVEGVRWGFSSRGSGVIRADGTVDENDYRLETWDGVMRPSTPGGFAQQPKPVKVREGEEKPTEEDAVQEDIEDAPEATILLEEITHIESELTEAFDSKLLNRFLHCFTQAKTLAEQKKLKASTQQAMFGHLLNGMQSVAKAIPDAEVSLTEDVEKTLADVTDEQNQVEMKRRAFERTVEKFQTKIAEVEEERDRATSQLSASEDKLNKSIVRLDEMNSANDGLKARVVVLETDLAESQSQLEAARVYIAEDSATEISDPVTEATEAVIEQYPELKGFQDVFERAATPERVGELAERLLQNPRTRASDSTPSPQERNAMPKGDVISESTVRTRVVTKHRGAVLAGKALKLIGNRLAPSK